MLIFFLMVWSVTLRQSSQARPTNHQSSNKRSLPTTMRATSRRMTKAADQQAASSQKSIREADDASTMIPEELPIRPASNNSRPASSIAEEIPGSPDVAINEDFHVRRSCTPESIPEEIPPGRDDHEVTIGGENWRAFRNNIIILFGYFGRQN